MSVIEIIDTQAIWKKTASKFASMTDASGMPIDPEILETVIALNVLDIPTTMSCGGHIDEQRGCILPWVDVEVSHPDLKELRQEVARLERIAERLQTEVHRLQANDAHWTLQKAAQDRADEKHWEIHAQVRRIRMLQCSVREKLVAYLARFYQGRDVSFDRRLILQLQTPFGRTRLLNQAATDFYLAAPHAIQQQKLIECREEIQDFTRFLKDIYFAQSETSVRQDANQAGR